METITLIEDWKIREGQTVLAGSTLSVDPIYKKQLIQAGKVEQEKTTKKSK